MKLRSGLLCAGLLMLAVAGCDSDPAASASDAGPSGTEDGSAAGDTGADTSVDDAAGGSPDAAVPDAAVPDAAVPDAAVPDTGSAPDSDHGEDAAGDTVTPVPPLLPELAEGWTTFYPGGDTICARGGEYAFAARKGTVNRLIVDFEGGGACWNELTCGFAGQIFKDSIDGTLENTDYAHGIYDRDNPANPFKDWYHVYIPYCTGDIHWGDSVTTYGEGETAVTINHKGAVNTTAVMDWIGENFSAPDVIFVTGCSAGAYGSIMWTPQLIERYPDARVVQMGDCGAGIITETFFFDSFPQWNALDVFPSWIEDLDPEKNDIYDLTLADLYGRIANAYPERVVSQFTSAYDENQTFYFQAMGGGDQVAWSEKMFASIEKAASLAPNFRSYVAPGELHCIVPFDELYTTEADGVKLIDWVSDLALGVPVESVSCQATGCGTPTK